MKKMLALVLAAMMLFAAVPGMAEEKVFKMGFDAEYPPYVRRWRIHRLRY